MRIPVPHHGIHLFFDTDKRICKHLMRHHLPVHLKTLRNIDKVRRCKQPRPFSCSRKDGRQKGTDRALSVRPRYMYHFHPSLRMSYSADQLQCIFRLVLFRKLWYFLYVSNCFFKIHFSFASFLIPLLAPKVLTASLCCRERP